MSVSYNDFSATHAAADSYVANVASGCQGIMKDAPHNEQFGILGSEALRALMAVMGGSKLSPISEFRHLVTHLNWSDKNLMLLVRYLADKEMATASLTLPKLCEDIQAWTRSGYRTVPPTTTKFLHASDVAEQIGTTTELKEGPAPKLSRCKRPAHGYRIICSETAEGPQGSVGSRLEVTAKEAWRLLKPYENSEELAMAHKTQQLESRLESEEGRLYSSAASQLSQNLGLDSEALSLFVGSSPKA